MIRPQRFLSLNIVNQKFVIPKTIEQLIKKLEQDAVVPKRVKRRKSGASVEKIVRGIERLTDKHHLIALTDIEPFVYALRNNPDNAIGMIFEKYHRALDKAYGEDRSFVQAVAGGPYETIPIALWNAIGTVYPLLNRDQKDRALQQVLEVLDRENYFCSQQQVEGIREPTLVSDICATRRLYWPGLEEGRILVEKYDSFLLLKEDILDENGLFKRSAVQSDFLVAVAILNPKVCNYGEQYVSAAHPIFLNRTLRGIAAILSAGTHRRTRKKDIKEWVPKSVYDRTIKFAEKHDWADPEKFPM